MLLLKIALMEHPCHSNPPKEATYRGTKLRQAESIDLSGACQLKRIIIHRRSQFKRIQHLHLHLSTRLQGMFLLRKMERPD